MDKDIFVFYIIRHIWDVEVAQWVETLVARSDNLGSTWIPPGRKRQPIPGNH